MNTTKTIHATAIAIVGAMPIGFASPTWAASVPSSTAAVATATPDAARDVRYYRDGYRRGYRNHGGLVAGGLALGVIGAVAGRGYYRDHAYEGPYGYGDSSDGYGYSRGYRHGTYDQYYGH